MNIRRELAKLSIEFSELLLRQSVFYTL